MAPRKSKKARKPQTSSSAVVSNSPNEDHSGTDGGSINLSGSYIDQSPKNGDSRKNSMTSPRSVLKSTENGASPRNVVSPRVLVVEKGDTILNSEAASPFRSPSTKAVVDAAKGKADSPGKLDFVVSPMSTGSGAAKVQSPKESSPKKTPKESPKQSPKISPKVVPESRKLSPKEDSMSPAKAGRVASMAMKFGGSRTTSPAVTSFKQDDILRESVDLATMLSTDGQVSVTVAPMTPTLSPGPEFPRLGESFKSKARTSMGAVASPTSGSKAASPVSGSKGASPKAQSKVVSPAAASNTASPAANAVSPKAASKPDSPSSASKIASPEATSKAASPAAASKIASPGGVSAAAASNAVSPKAASKSASPASVPEIVSPSGTSPASASKVASPKDVSVVVSSPKTAVPVAVLPPTPVTRPMVTLATPGGADVAVPPTARSAEPIVLSEATSPKGASPKPATPSPKSVSPKMESPKVESPKVESPTGLSPNAVTSPKPATAADSWTLAESSVAPQSDAFHSVTESMPALTLITFAEAMTYVAGTSGKSLMRTEEASAAETPAVKPKGLAAMCGGCFGIIRRAAKLDEALQADQDVQTILSNTPVNIQVDTHRQMLQTIYVFFTNDSKVDLPMVGAHWEALGFEGVSDITASLNKANGILNVLHMLYFVDECSEEARVLFHDCRKGGLPFAATSIAITGMVTDLAARGKLTMAFNSARNVVHVTARMYVALFKQFVAQWTKNATSIVDFDKARKALLKQTESGTAAINNLLL